MRVKSVTGRAAVGCLFVAAVVAVALSLTGNPRAGLAVGLGLMIGSLNGVVAQRALSSGLSPQWTSLPRLALFSGAALGGGLLLGADQAWLVILGVAAAQGVLVAVAARSLFTR